jgi:hypothetical protein
MTGRVMLGSGPLRAPGEFMKQELLRKSNTPHLDAMLERSVRAVMYVAAAVFWLHEILAPSQDRSRPK